MSHLLVVHCKRAAYDVYVGCPSEWWNPFHVGPEYFRGMAVREYARWFHAQPALIERAKAELAGKVLGCWCAPQDCHADVLARAANTRGIRLAVTGGRAYPTAAVVDDCLFQIQERFGIAVVIHGDAGKEDEEGIVSGADRLAGEWARFNNVQEVAEPVTREEWNRLGAKAGPLRNQRMLDRYLPNMLLALPGDRGTADMTERAREAGLPIAKFTPEKGLRWITEKLVV